MNKEIVKTITPSIGIGFIYKCLQQPYNCSSIKDTSHIWGKKTANAATSGHSDVLLERCSGYRIIGQNVSGGSDF